MTNDEMLQNINEMRVEESRRRGSLIKKYVEAVKVDMRANGVKRNGVE